ncbi:hypothetical protein HYS92_01435 [Candidatus Daviesbacteria bacterium]|nr:hypothetical protein [Candidatus Daviesbacteria bacterium]
MTKLHLFLLSLSVIIITAIVTILFNSPQDKPSKAEIEIATNQASLLYRQMGLAPDSLIFGPCLSDALMEGWVADIVHSPREAVDDLPENQCPSHREGRAKHIVELDLEGEVVKVK